MQCWPGTGGGASEDEIVDVLLAIAPVAGLGRSAPLSMWTALGNIAAALENWTMADGRRAGAPRSPDLTGRARAAAHGGSEYTIVEALLLLAAGGLSTLAQATDCVGPASQRGCAITFRSQAVAKQRDQVHIVSYRGAWVGVPRGGRMPG